ncbi:MAG: hypothetical protein N3F66_09505 [Spirochaetes bacterium]|nr:hypothetical protein [Spirochaetota bacterium]
MNFKNIFLAIVTVILFSSCGALQEEHAVIAGSVTVDDTITRNADAPLFVAIARDSNMEAIQNDPANTIIAVIHTDITGSYSIECKDYGLKAGDEVFLFAFIDNDYTGGIPFPTPGDAVGFFNNGFKLSYTVGVDGRADILINRQQYDFDATIIGILDGTESGNVILIAYAGDFNSSNFSDIDINAVIAYKKIAKPAYPVSFSLPVMPYGYNVPVGGVYVIALLDVNNNGIPDEGDKIGFAVESGSNTPVTVTVPHGVVSASTIKFLMPIYGEPETGEPPLTITGQFDAPEGYSSDPTTKPIFIVVAKGSDPNEVFANIQNLNTQTFDYMRVPQGGNTFALTLSRSKFTPGDSVFIFALWDRDYESGLPNATEGDKLGFVVNKSNFAYTVTLQEGDNQLVKSGQQYLFNGQNGYSFALNRNIYNHNASIRFQLEKGSLNDTQFANGTKVLCVAVYETNDIAQQFLQNGTYNLDMDKIIATTTVRINRPSGSNTTVYYTMPVIPALLDSIPAKQDGQLFINNVWVLAVLDSNGNGKPDDGERIGFYWGYFIVYYPIKLPLPLGDGTTILNKTVRFSNYTY